MPLAGVCEVLGVSAVGVSAVGVSAVGVSAGRSGYRSSALL
jgi:hypothetical protein